MHPWSPLNDRQLALLTRIGDGTAPVTSDSPEFALTARALKERRLITMLKRSGKWQAEITDAGPCGMGPRWIGSRHARRRPDAFLP